MNHMGFEGFYGFMCFICFMGLMGVMGFMGPCDIFAWHGNMLDNITCSNVIYGFQGN